MNRRRRGRRGRRGGTGSTTARTDDTVEIQETGGTRRADGAESLETTVPMVYDGYYGDFVPVEHASFDVSATPAALHRRRGAGSPI